MYFRASYLSVIVVMTIQTIYTAPFAALVEGFPGQDPSMICSSRGYADTMVRPFDLSAMREFLCTAGVDRAYVSGYNGEVIDFVIEASGPVVPYDPLINPVRHAFCVVRNRKSVDNCAPVIIEERGNARRSDRETGITTFPLKVNPSVPSFLSNGEDSKVKKILHLRKHEPKCSFNSNDDVVYDLEDLAAIKSENTSFYENAVPRFTFNYEKPTKDAIEEDLPLSNLRSKVAQLLPKGTAIMRCRRKPVPEVQAGSVRRAMRCRRKPVRSPDLEDHEYPTDRSYTNSWIERLNQDKSKGSPCSVGRTAPAGGFGSGKLAGARKRILEDALALPSPYDLVALRSLIAAGDDIDIEMLRNLENTIPNVSRTRS